MQVDDLHFTENVTLLQVFSNYFASKSQLPGLSVSGTLVENGLMLAALLIIWDLHQYFFNLPQAKISLLLKAAVITETVIFYSF